MACALGCAVTVPIAEEDLVLGDVPSTETERELGIDVDEGSEQRSLTPAPNVAPSVEGSPATARPDSQAMDDSMAEPPSADSPSSDSEGDSEQLPTDEAATPEESANDPETPAADVPAGDTPPSDEADDSPAPIDPVEELPAPATPALDPNLVSNASFELGTEGWEPSFDAELQRSTAQASAGVASALVTRRTESWQGALFDLVDVVSPGSQYQAALSVRVSGQNATSVLFTVQVQCAGQADQFVQIAAGTATALAWTRLSGQLVVPSANACNLTGFLIYAEGPPPGVDLFIDEVSVLP